MERFYRPAAPAKPRSQSLPGEGAPWGKPSAAPNRAAISATESEEDREDEAFLRARRRVRVRRGVFPKSTAGRIALVAGILLALGALAALALAVRNFLRDDPRFRIDSSSSIQVMGNSQVTRQELLSVFGSDIGRNIFFVPLGNRRAALEHLPWVAQATVMRLLPNQLRISIVERTPVAFVRAGNTIELVDGQGVLLNLPAGMMVAKRYSFPVVTGISPRDPLPVRAARMHAYLQFIGELNSGGANISQRLSEVDISDPEDIRALLPAQGSDILAHFGESDFLARYNRFEQHLAEWRQQYPHLASVDLRYQNQVVLEMAKGAEQSPQRSLPARSLNDASAHPADRHNPEHSAVHAPVREVRQVRIKARLAAAPLTSAKSTHQRNERNKSGKQSGKPVRKER